MLHFCFNYSTRTVEALAAMIHYENTPIQIYCKFHLEKTENFQMKN